MLDSLPFKITKGIDTLNEWVGRGVAWITLLLVLVVFADVVMRYLFNKSFVFTQELEWHLLAFPYVMSILWDGTRCSWWARCFAWGS